MASAVEYRGDLSARGRGRSWLWHARQPFVPPVKGLLRGWGMVTGAARAGPDFIVIGAKRGGSTSIYRNLAATPGVLPLFPGPAQIKGTYYFDVEFRRGARWYRSHFPTRRARAAHPDVDGSPALSGEASPYYLSHPHAARRAAALLPAARIVVALRDPVRRAHSHYRERVRQGIETIPTFGAAIAAEPARLAGEWDRMTDDPSYVSAAHLNFGYLAQSEYDRGLQRWLEAYPRDRVLVLRSEDYYLDERATLSELREFLGLAPVALPPPRHYNETGSDDLDPGLVAELWDRLGPSVQRLEQLTGRRFDWT
jgi:hypothetical protein